MHSLRELRRRIRSISSTAQITKAMEMVAASKMRKAQEAALAGRPFVHLLYRIQREATTRMMDFSHPLLEVRPVRKRAVILVGADKGLCGALNSNLFRLAAQFDPQSTVFITAGRKAAQFVARTRRQLVAEFAYGDEPKFPEARAIAAFARGLFLKKEADQVLVVATQFINTLTQLPVCLEFLPVGEIKGLKVPGMEPEEELAADTTGSLFEPSPEAVLSYLLSHYLNIYTYQVLLNAKAAPRLLRAHVGGSAQYPSFGGARFGHGRRLGKVRPTLSPKGLGQTKVQHLDLAFGGHLDVGRLQVSVDHPFFVRRFQGFRKPAADPESLRDASGPALSRSASVSPRTSSITR